MLRLASYKKLRASWTSSKLASAETPSLLRLQGAFNISFTECNTSALPENVDFLLL